jgi:mRNA interferase MazF
MDKSPQETDYDLKYKELISDKDARFLCEQFERGEEKRMENLHDQFSKPFGRWTELKRSLGELDIKQDSHEREVWWCSVGINLGYEEDGKNSFFERPILVLRKYSKDFLLAASLTSTIKSGPHYFPVVIHGTNRSVILSQQRSISVRRLNRKICVLGKTTFKHIIESIIKSYPKIEIPV